MPNRSEGPGPSAIAGLTACHRGGTGTPMVLLHGFTGPWRVWELDVPLETAQLILGFTAG